MQTPVFNIGHGIVTKVRNDDNNKYVVVEHRNVKYKNKIGKYYSSYLHLDSVAVNVGDVVSKGSMIGRVGMSGITTTPHLHLQIDNEDAPFYPYWSFSLEDAGNAGMSFFD
jgi:murein DD-endopeptidase MepM/ murein hydrolase activator NlpD